MTYMLFKPILTSKISLLSRITCLAYVFLIVLIVGCDDGYLNIERINFDDVAVQSCDNSISNQLFFKISNNEALILILEKGLLKNEPMTTPLTSDIPSASKLYYRLFSDNISKTYFCDLIPQTNPVVTDEILTKSGFVNISTVEILSDDGTPKSYEHTITLNDVYIENSSGESIIDNTVFFGLVTTVP